MTTSGMPIPYFSKGTATAVGQLPCKPPAFSISSANTNQLWVAWQSFGEAGPTTEAELGLMGQRQ